MRTNKVVIPIAIGIIIVIVGIIATSNQEDNTMKIIEEGDALDRELTPDEEIALKIQEKYDAIEKANLENKYSPKSSEWITSGPFQIDRSEYILGEKIFGRVGELGPEEKGQIAFLNPLNSTHYSIYRTIPFDGSIKSTFNYYFPPVLSRVGQHCTVDDLIGDWRVVFKGTDYPNLEFKITADILPGQEDDYEPVC